ncbi:MAG: hypothetical protein A3F68_03275 [Acidobacteria bacterium RIFCSPLOWO2_12_FULL_54_10]|nr:MAG: hypothetical protein A3F68_03275 [Acidobacteria bacterium RIFCSPLOWO2_12_FULL_54_10]
MSIKLSRYFKISALQLRKLGVFNALIGLDNSLFVDPKLLKTAKVSEFKNSRTEVEDYFSKVIRLLRASKRQGDVAWSAALSKLTFEEENGAALGYSGAGGHGKAIGPELAKRLCARAAEIVALGIDDPVIFELIPLFEEGFGADRLSDMAVGILDKRFHSYTQRVVSALDLKPNAKFRFGGNDWHLPLHPDGKTPLIFIPCELLNDLPIALARSEIDEVSKFNEEVRIGWSEIFATATKQKRRPSKHEIRELFLKNPKNLRDLIEVYRKSNPVGYDFDRDPKGLFDWDEIGREVAIKFPLNLEIRKPASLAELKTIVNAIIRQFQRNVEDNKLYEVLYDDDLKPRLERFSQRLFYAVADSYCAANNIDISREPNAGNGPVDFKLSSGYTGRILVEVKLSSSPRLIHGFETQLPAYQQSEATRESVYLIMRLPGSDASIKNVQKLRDNAIKVGKKVPSIFVIDARPQKSATKR